MNTQPQAIQTKSEVFDLLKQHQSNIKSFGVERLGLLAHLYGIIRKMIAMSIKMKFPSLKFGLIKLLIEKSKN